MRLKTRLFSQSSVLNTLSYFFRFKPALKKPPPTTPRTPAPRANNNAATESLQVFCRLRPTEDGCCVQVVNDTTVRLTVPESAVNFRPGACREYQYSFKKIFTQIHHQKDVFNTVALPLVENLIRGRNGLMFTYGVTGSGKTYTMTGQESGDGILPRCLDVLFNTISDYQAKKYVFKPDRMNGFEVQSEADALREQEEVLRGTYSKGCKLKK
jgi:kinesin family protein 23